jgi:hypothetical protein
MCECIKIVNQKLANAGYNTRINQPLCLDGIARVLIVTEKADKSMKKKPVSMMRVMDGAQWDAAVLVRGEDE